MKLLANKGVTYAVKLTKQYDEVDTLWVDDLEFLTLYLTNQIQPDCELYINDAFAVPTTTKDVYDAIINNINTRIWYEISKGDKYGRI